MCHDPSAGKYDGGARPGEMRATLCISSQVRPRPALTHPVTSHQSQVASRATRAHQSQAISRASKVTSHKLRGTLSSSHCCYDSEIPKVSFVPLPLRL